MWYFTVVSLHQTVRDHFPEFRERALQTERPSLVTLRMWRNTSLWSEINQHCTGVHFCRQTNVFFFLAVHVSLIVAQSCSVCIIHVIDFSLALSLSLCWNDFKTRPVFFLREHVETTSTATRSINAAASAAGWFDEALFYCQRCGLDNNY